MGAAAGTLKSRRYFCRDGLLARWHPAYEYRPGQLQMAEAVESALNDGRILIVEAGTGTGKTLAYLIPVILSGRKVVISTGAKTLQEQLFFKDVPFLEEHLDRPLSVCYMKGRNNYACRQKIYDAEKEPILSGLEEVTDFQIIREWEKVTETGDRAEISELPESSTAWAKIDARREACTGQKCANFDRCFLTLMRRRAQESQVIIVNHHLFFADLALRAAELDSVLPDYEAVIFDEAHELEEVAGQYFGLSISNYQIQELCRDTTAWARQKQFCSEELDRIVLTIESRAERFFPLFGDREGRAGFREREAFLEQHEDAYRELTNALRLLSNHFQVMDGAPEEAGLLAVRAVELAENLSRWMEGPETATVYWVERRGRGVFLQATPIDVSGILSGALFDQVHAAVLTSATLAVGGNFEYIKARLGIRQARELIVPSPFDYRRQALLYVPQHLPDPRAPEFTRLAAEEVVRLLQLSRGRAFVLFTSYQQMKQIYELADPRLDYPTLIQGTAPRKALLDEFRRTPHCVLFATSSFWQGVDVPGEQLSCVIIDKLPFAVPSDPVVEARIRMLREEGRDAFYQYQVPEAAIALKQGFGRLIRGAKDRGILALLDNRITKTRYGQVFFDSLPEYSFTTRIEDVEKFFDV